MQILTTSVEETVELGTLIGQIAPPNTCIALHGNLGAGKTQLTRGIAIGAQVLDPSLVSSPTYVLLNIYEAGPGHKPVFHMDAYRVESEDDFAVVGFDELLTAGGISVIEWAGRIQHLLPLDRVEISMEPGEGENERVIAFTATGPITVKFLQQLGTAWAAFRNP